MRPAFPALTRRAFCQCSASLRASSARPYMKTDSSTRATPSRKMGLGHCRRRGTGGAESRWAREPARRGRGARWRTAPPAYARERAGMPCTGAAAGGTTAGTQEQQRRAQQQARRSSTASSRHAGAAQQAAAEQHGTKALAWPKSGMATSTVRMTEMASAKFFRMLSQYLTTMPVTRPPNTWGHTRSHGVDWRGGVRGRGKGRWGGLVADR